MSGYNHNRDRDKAVADTIFPGSNELKRDSRGDFLGHEHNVAICLKGTLGSFLAYNLLTHEACYLAHPPWHDKEQDGEDIPRIDDYQIDKLVKWVQKHHIPTRRGIVEEGLDSVARECCSFHPVQQYFDSLTWDNVPRVDSFFHTELGAEDSDYTRLASRILLTSIAARVYEPGCKVDTCIVLVGTQGTLKSTAIKAMAIREGWYADGIGADGRIDAQACLAFGPKLITELGDIDQYMAGSTGRRLKSLITRQVDIFKRPYGRKMTEQPRGCIFIGSTNSSYFLRDPTGNRRFIPVRCWTRRNFTVNVNSLSRQWPQYLAEAVYLYRNEVAWYPVDQDERDLLESRAKEHSVPSRFDLAIDEYLFGSSIIPGQRMESVTVDNIILFIAGSERWKGLFTDPRLPKYIPSRLHDLGYEEHRQSNGSGRRERNGRLQRESSWNLRGENA